MAKKTTTRKKSATKATTNVAIPAVNQTVAPVTGTTDTPPEQAPPITDVVNKGPGDGIDTNGDGNADFVVQPPDKSGKKSVKKVEDEEPEKSDVDYIKESQITEHHKEIMLTQLKDGELNPPYVDALYRIKSAIKGGSVYRPGQDGY